MVVLLELVTVEKMKTFPPLSSLFAFLQAKMKDLNATSHFLALLCRCSQACNLKHKRQFVMKFLFGASFLYVWNVANIWLPN